MPDNLENGQKMAKFWELAKKWPKDFSYGQTVWS